MIKLIFKIVFVFLMLSLYNNSFSQVKVLPTSVKMATKKTLIEYLGSLKVDSNFILPIRNKNFESANYSVKGAIYFDTIDNLLRYYDGNIFQVITSSSNNKSWSRVGDSIKGSDSALGTKDNYSLVFLQNNINKLILTRDGYLGINNTKPEYHLDVNGTIRAKSAIFLRALSATMPSTYSDIRFKKDIVNIPNALKTVLSLQGVSYNMKTEEYPDKNFPKSKQIGLIAQQVEKIIPDAVNTETDGFKSVSYTMLIPYLIEATKQQNEIINDLKKVVENQQKQINELLNNSKK